LGLNQAKYLKTGKTTALKVVPFEPGEDLNEILIEVNLLRNLSHPNVAAYYACYFLSDAPNGSGTIWVFSLISLFPSLFFQLLSLSLSLFLLLLSTCPFVLTLFLDCDGILWWRFYSIDFKGSLIISLFYFISLSLSIFFFFFL